MKIVYLAAGAGGMYCGSCLHDNTLAAALMAQGEDVVLMPTYTPLKTDEQNVSDPRLFFGGINVYLQQKVALFRHTPWFVDALLDNQKMISWVTRGGPSLEAEKLGDLTVSMLQGEAGRQRKEIEKLVHWLKGEPRPDVVNLSNSMLLGMAREIKKLGIPVVCSLSGEDIFLERLPAPFYEQARAVLRERAAQIDGFIAMNHYYADYMADYLAVPRERVHVIPHGLNLIGHGTRQGTADGVITIGYLARICEDKGLHNLVEAAEILLADSSVPAFRIRAAGFLSQLDRPYLAAIQKRVQGWSDPSRFEYIGEPDRAGKIRFMQSLDVFCLPTVYRESKGIPPLEALANAVPVVLPEHGSFAELVRSTGGGVLYPAGDASALATALRQLMLEPEEAGRLGVVGQQAIHRDHTAAGMAERHRSLYANLIDSRQPERSAQRNG